MTVTTEQMTDYAEDDVLTAERHSVPTEDGRSSREDPATVYRNLLSGLPEMIDYLYEHFDDVVGHGLEFREAAKTLGDAISFFEMLLDNEVALA